MHNGISNFIDRVINLIKICHLMLKYTFKMLVENNYGHFETSTPCVSTFIYLSLNYSWLPITFNTDVGSSYIILGHVISVIATQIEHSREQDHVHDDVLIRKILQKKYQKAGQCAAKVQIENTDFVIMSYLIERILIAYVNYECWRILPLPS